MLLKTLMILFDVIEFMLFAYVILSWFVPDRRHPLMAVLGIFVDPILIPVRALSDRFLPNTGFLDFSVMIAFLVLRLIRYLAVNLMLYALYL